MNKAAATVFSAIFLAGGFALFSGGAALANPLEEELVYILTQHPTIQQNEKLVEARHQNIDQAFAGFYPTVNLVTTAGPEHIDSPAERLEGKDGASSRTKNTATLTVTQNLFNGFNTSSSVKSAELNKQIARLTLEGTRQGVIFEGISNYINVLRQRHLVGLSRLNEATIQRQLNLEDERVRRGSGIAVDVLQAKSRLQIAKERRVTFEGALEDAVSRYAQVYNRAPNLNSMTDPVPPVYLIPSEIERAIEIALVRNPAIGNGAFTTEIARERRTLTRSEYFPVVDMIGTLNYEKNNASALGTRRDYTLTLQTNWNLFTGFSTMAGEAGANFEYRASQDNQVFIARKIVEQTRLAWQALLTSRERVGLLENAVSIASEVFSARKKLREAGKETVINVLDAENEVVNAQINYTSASFDERVAIYQILLAMGQLNAANLNLNI